jgi:hypothetical protein
MNRIECTVLAVVIGSHYPSQLAAASSNSRKIDGPHSTITVPSTRVASFPLLVTIMKFRHRFNPAK